MTAAAPELASKLRLEGGKLAAFLEGLSQEDWQREVYTEGTVWTVRNVLAHLVTAERAFLHSLFPSVRQGKGGASVDFSIDRYNARQQEKSRDLGPSELLVAFRSTRARMADWVAELSETDLEKVGRHPYLGETTLREMVKMVYLHNQIHSRDVRKALE